MTDSNINWPTGMHPGNDPAEDCAESDAIEQAEFDKRWSEIKKGRNTTGAIAVIEEMQADDRWPLVVESIINLHRSVNYCVGGDVHLMAFRFDGIFSSVFDSAVEKMKSTGEMPPSDEDVPALLRPQAE